MNQPIFILGALREEITLIRKLMIVKEQIKARTCGCMDRKLGRSQYCFSTNGYG